MRGWSDAAVDCLHRLTVVTMTRRDLWREVSQFHENEKTIAWLRDCRVIQWLTPSRRRAVLVFGATIGGVVGLFNRHAEWRDYAKLDTWLAPSLALPLLFVLVYLLYLAAKHFQRLPAAVRRRPQIAFHLLFWLLLAWIWLAPLGPGIWQTVIALIALSLPFILWRIGYTLMSGQRGKAAKTTFKDHLFYFWPIWGGTNTPIGKGADYLAQHEARSADAYARSVLAGVKLLLLSRLWDLTRMVMAALVFANPKSPFMPLLGEYSLNIPRVQSILGGSVAATPFTTWASLYFELVWETLEVAENGHVWVGLLRLFGFHVFRNTYKPLRAESITEFWSRYHYYFKELLVDFFFLPTYVRYFKRWPRLRMLAAVFAAAFAGNMYHHVLKAKNSLVAGEFADLWIMLNPRLVYCFLLAVGIYCAMLREQKTRGTKTQVRSAAAPLSRVLKIAGVWTFYCIIHIWNLKGSSSITERNALFLSLFGW
jgi:hypothetical protein